MYQKESNLLYLLSVKIVIGVLIGVYCLFIKIYYTAVINKKKKKNDFAKRYVDFTHIIYYTKNSYLCIFCLEKSHMMFFRGGGGNIENVI